MDEDPVVGCAFNFLLAGLLWVVLFLVLAVTIFILTRNA